MIRDITAALYAEKPQERLYHYTSFSGLVGIVGSRSLWASDIRYMNDSAELKHTADLIRSEISRRLTAGGHNRHRLFNQFLDWFTFRITNGHMLFAASFRASGNLLSQWRGYSRPGKGVSLGFSPDYLLPCADRQSFEIGRCIYDSEQQGLLIRQVMDAVESLADAHGVDGDGRSSENSYLTIFQEIESDLLRIAAILKHPSFREEEEWRLVSPVVTDYLEAPVLFREGTSMLVPYIQFPLAGEDDSPIHLDHIFLGPTSNITISMNSLTMFLAKNGIQPKNGISYCQIPFRAR